MTPEDVLRFHQDRGREYLAYAYPDSAAIYPTGARRTEAAAAALQGELGAAAGNAIDLGCGRGDLCCLLAAVGTTVAGIDFSETMLAEARTRLASLPADARARVSLIHADIYGNGVNDGSVDAVAAIGVLETEPSDAALFAEARRMLRAGGVFVVSCRNRLFNLVSVNRHTRAELDAGTLGDLLAEAEELLQASSPTTTAGALTGFADRMREAAALPRGESIAAAPAAVRIGETRQHTPVQLKRFAHGNGFHGGTFIGVHPHPLPPVMEAMEPAAYNRIAAAAEAFQHEPMGLVWSSAFVAAFTKR